MLPNGFIALCAKYFNYFSFKKPYTLPLSVILCFILFQYIIRSTHEVNPPPQDNQIYTYSIQQSQWIKVNNNSQSDNIVKRNNEKHVQTQSRWSHIQQNVIILRQQTQKDNVSILGIKKLQNTPILQLPRLQFLKNHASRCFYEETPGRRNQTQLIKVCLPSILYAGFPKCASTDLYKRLEKHPHIIPTPIKEPLFWWSRGRHLPQKQRDIHKYLTKIQSSQKINKIVQPCSDNKRAQCYPAHLADFSTRDLMNEYRPYLEGGNQWDLIHHLNPTAKYIVFMRNPVDRLYSDYVYFSTVYKGNKFNVTPEYFHTQVLRIIAWWSNCTSRFDIRTCMYGQVKGMPPLRIDHGDCWAGKPPQVCAAFRIGFYSYYIADWMKTITEDNFIFIRTETYAKNTTSVLNNLVSFLNLKSFSNNTTQQLEHQGKSYPLGRNSKAEANKKDAFREMLPQTRILLQKLYKDSNTKLAKLINDDPLIWDDV